MHEGARTIEPPAEPEPSAEGAGDGGLRRGGSRRKAKERSGLGVRLLKWTTLGLSVIILGTAGVGYLYIEHLNGNIRKGSRSNGGSDVAKSKANADGQTPLNILLLGSDSRAKDENIELGGSAADRDRPPLADVQMLLHVSADRKNASLLSIPRDTRVEIPECTDAKTDEHFEATNDLINTSLARGGAGCVLDTWQELTGVYIDHWMMIDFAGVVSMADEVGGVEVCTTAGFWDRDLAKGTGGSGLKMEAGSEKVKGKRALQWLRTRYAWGSDINRTKAQHMYMNSMMSTLRKQNVFTDTGRLMGLADAATKALTVDEGLGTVQELFDLGMELKSVPQNRITSLTLPVDPDPLDPNAHLVPRPGESEKIFSMLRNDIPLDSNGKAKGSGGDKSDDKSAKKLPAATAPASLPVGVINGTGANGKAPVQQRATTVATFLTQGGFTQAGALQEARPREDTVVEYPESAGDQGKADARSVAKALKIPNSAVKASDEATGVTVVVGADWTEGTDYSATLPEEGDVPADANALNGTDKECMTPYDPYVWPKA